MNFLLVEKIFFYAAFALYAAAMILFFVFFALKSEKAGKIANALMAAAFVCHTLALVVRGIGLQLRLGHLPLLSGVPVAVQLPGHGRLCHSGDSRHHCLRRPAE